VVVRGLAADPLGFPLARHAAHAEETQVRVVGRHGRVHVPDRFEVIAAGRPDLDRGAVG